MYGQLGDIVFEGLFGLDSFNLKGSQVIAEHSRIQGKPSLENSGSKADEISVSFKLSSWFTNPEQQIEKIKAYKEAGEVLVFINGAGIVFGDYVIKEYDYSIDDLTPGGQIINATVNVSLIENYYTDRKKAEERSAAANGFGAPGAISRVEPLSFVGESAPVMRDMQKINADAASVSNNLTSAQQFANQANNWMDTASKKLDETRQTITGLETRLTDSLTLGDSASNLLAQLPALTTAITNLQAPLNAHDLQTALGLNGLFQAKTSIVNALAAPIAGMVAIKK